MPDLAIPDGLSENEQITRTKNKNLELARFLDQQFPQREETLVVMGNAYQQMGQNSAAERCYHQVLSLNSRRPDVYDSLAMIAVKQGDYPRAIELWKKLLQVDPYYPQAHVSLAQAYVRQGEHPQALQLLTNAINLFPNSALTWSLCGQEYQRNNDWPQAKACYEKAIRLNTNSTQSYYGLGTVCARMDLADQAKEYLARFNQLKNEDTKKLIDRRHDYDDLDKVSKDFALTCLAAGSIFQQQGDAKTAAVCYQRASMLAQNDAAVLNRLAIVHHANQQIEEAIALRRRIATLAPQDAMNVFYLGGLLHDCRRPDEAQAAFEKVTAIAPQFSGGYRELARLELQLDGRLDEALRLAEKAVQLEPVAVNYFMLSWALGRNGNHTEALAAIKRATELEPDNAQYRKVYELALQKIKKP
jgi:O-antigen biosynthesis protein